MELKSVGMMTFPTEWKVIKIMFQTTNQPNFMKFPYGGSSSLVDPVFQQGRNWKLVDSVDRKVGNLIFLEET
jgi:hypothetical protein